MKAASVVHGAFVAPRRAAVLARAIAELLPARLSVLDLGAGDGLLASLVRNDRPDLTMTAVDVIPRHQTFVPVMQYDGVRAPFDDRAFDVVMLVDVLHHAKDPKALFGEAIRLARRRIVIKDHICENGFDRMILRFMDRVSNARFGVALPYTYLSREEWRDLFSSGGPAITWNESLRLYPWPASVLFDRSLHLLAQIDVDRSAGSR